MRKSPVTLDQALRQLSVAVVRLNSILREELFKESTFRLISIVSGMCLGILAAEILAAILL